MKFFYLLLLIACSLEGSIKVAIASENPIKINAVLKSFKARFETNEIEAIAYASPSEIPDQPVGQKSALKGVHNRLNNLPELKAHFAVAIENYIELTENGLWQDAALVLIEDLSSGHIMMATSKPTPIPEHFVALSKDLSEHITEDGWSKSVGQVLSEHFPIDAHDWHREPEFGSISRETLIEEALFKALHTKELAYLKQKIERYPDFPKPGILFENFFPLLADPESFSLCLDILAKYYKNKGIDAIAGLESRGFILGAALACRLNVGFIPIRKPGKMPGEVFTHTYEKEYGTDTLVISKHALKEGDRVLIVDDLIATGGSAKAAIALVRKIGAEPIEFMSLLQVEACKGRDGLGIPSFNLLD